MLILSGLFLLFLTHISNTQNLKPEIVSEYAPRTPPTTYPSSYRHLDMLLKIDNEMYDKIKNGSTNKNFTKRQVEICKDFMFDFDKISPELRENYGNHPLLMFSIIQRYYRLPGALLLNLYEELTKHLKAQKLKLGWPEVEDYFDSMQSINRIVNFYDLDLKKVRRGILHKNDHLSKIPIKKNPIKLDASDCLYFGLQAGHKGYFTLAIEWIEMAQKILLTEKDISTNLPFVEGYLSDAIEKHNNQLQRNTIGLNLNLYKDPVVQQSNIKRIKQKSEILKNLSKIIKSNRNDSIAFQTKFTALCKGHKLLAKKWSKSKLYCENRRIEDLYEFIKVEYLSIDPPIMRLYDVVQDWEIDYLKNISIQVDNKWFLQYTWQELENGAHFAIYGDLRGVVDLKISKISKIIDQISTLIGCPSRKCIEKNTQIHSYPAGMYRKSFDSGIFPGNVTFISFLSDVEAGGQTAFVQELISVKPIKGSAILYGNGKNGNQVFHSDCPVISGRKWEFLKSYH